MSVFEPFGGGGALLGMGSVCLVVHMPLFHKNAKSY
jgi:hypothetical protein